MTVSVIKAINFLAFSSLLLISDSLSASYFSISLVYSYNSIQFSLDASSVNLLCSDISVSLGPLLVGLLGFVEVVFF